MLGFGSEVDPAAVPVCRVRKIADISGGIFSQETRYCSQFSESSHAEPHKLRPSTRHSGNKASSVGQKESELSFSIFTPLRTVSFTVKITGYSH